MDHVLTNEGTADIQTGVITYITFSKPKKQLV